MNADPQPSAPPTGEQLFHIAFAERKKMNLQLLKQFVQARCQSIRERTHIYSSLQTLFKDKIEYTKQFIKDFIKYFEDTLGLYSSFFKSIGKLDLNKKNKEHFIYEAFQRAALELTELNQAQVQHLKVLTTWIQKILIPALQAVLDLYRDWTKDTKKEMQSQESDFQSSHSKDMKFYQKLTDNNDLLQNEIIFADKIQQTDAFLVKWGRHLYSAWVDLLKKEGQIREQLQKNLIEFHDKFTRVYNQSESSKALLKFWMQIQGVSSWHKTFSSVLSEKDAEFISYGCKSNQIKHNFQAFIDLVFQKDRVGDPFKLVQILQNKRFKSKLQKSQRQYINVRVYFTIENNVLVFDQAKKKVVLKLKEDGFKIRRLSENLIEISGIQVGIVFDSQRRENIHFGTMDEAEEFAFFVENLLEETKQGKNIQK